ncbi:MAG: FAD-dependent oxidoreductase [Bacteroidota bacterium]|nr:FAD-dependent oxidoreductase [Bacteroidota bacterium]
MKRLDLLVIGGGPAAVTIAKTIKDKMTVGIIRPEDHSMIYCAMPYAIEELLPLEKTLKNDSVVTDEKVELIRDKVVSVNFEEKIVTTEKGDTIGYEKLVIATGANPILPPIKGSNLNNVMTFKTEENLKEIMNTIDNGLKKAVVIGAGAIGIELAQALNERKVETHLVDMAEHVLPNMVDSEMIEEAQNSLSKSGVYLHLKSKVEALKGDDVVTEVVLGNDSSIKFDESGLVVFAVGMKPNVEMFKNTNLAVERDGIVINNRMETNIKDVYAVGDCCQFTSGISGEVLSGKLATNAVPMGKVLAKNLLGEDRVYSGFYNGAATKINEYFIGGTGFSETAAKKMFDVEIGYANLTTAFPVMPGAKKVTLKLIVDRKTRKVVGGQFISGEPVADKVDKITMAIQYGITVDQLVNFSYSSQPYQSFFPANNLIVQASENILKVFNNKEKELKRELVAATCSN